MTLIPSTLTEGQDLICREGILFEAAKEKEGMTHSTIWRAMDRYYEWDDYVVFFGFL
jgi:hypothetical protein